MTKVEKIVQALTQEGSLIFASNLSFAEKLEKMIPRYPAVQTDIDHVSQIDLGVDDPLPDLKKLLALARYPNVAVKISDLSLIHI